MIWLASIRAGLFSALGRIPRWAWLTLLALTGIWLLRADANHNGYEEGQRDLEDDIREKTNEQIQAAIDAENAITEQLNREQLRKLAARDPNNLGPLPHN